MLLRNCLLLSTFFTATLLAADAQNLVANGDFEAGTSKVLRQNFDMTPGWYNRAGKQNATARIGDQNLGDSSFNAVVDDRSGATILHSQRTEYSIQAGDTFTVSFDWLSNPVSWNDRDFVRLVLFATDNDRLNGTVVWEHQFDSPTRVRAGNWETLYGQSTAVDAAAVGKRLFVNFYGVDPQGDEFTSPGYARVDNLTVTRTED